MIGQSESSDTVQTTRWKVRAHSIAECAEQLAQIWSAAADQVEQRPLSDAERERASSDPHLAGRVDPHGAVRVRMRTSVLTLVAIAPRTETAERAMAAINALNQRHPSRAIVVSPGDFDGPAMTDAHIYAECKLSSRSDAELCTERVLVKTGGELAQHLARVVTPLLIHDLPVVVWWPDDVPVGSIQFEQVAGLADRLLVDSGAFRDDGLARLPGIAAVISAGVPVMDIGWLRLTLWRELLAALFDHPLLTPELGRVSRVRIDVARPGSVYRLAKAAYFCGWLAGRLGWRVAQPLAAADDGEGVLAGTWRHGRQKIDIELRPTRAAQAGARLGAGSLMRVEVEAGGPKSAVRALITRQADHLLATAEWNGAEVWRRAGQLEAFDETPFVAEALERPGRDPVFERSLAMAVEFSAGGAR
jgi:glucose-6-phosphate dehydrogenase assembly protein OpcA